MNILIRNTFCLVFVVIFVNCAQAQTIRIAKGFFCGMSEGDGGYPSIRVGGKERRFAIYGDEPDVIFVGFKNEKQKWLDESLLGWEMIVSYVFKKPKLGGQPVEIVRKLTLTGKTNRQTKSCGFGL